MNISLHAPLSGPRHVSGPGDLNAAGPGSTIVVSGSPDAQRDFGRWAGPLGSAVLRGANIRRTS